MSTPTLSPSSSAPPVWWHKLASPRRWFSQAYVVFIALVMGMTGWIALTEGLARYLPQLRNDPATQFDAAQVAAMRANPSPEVLHRYSPELSMLSRATDLHRFTQSALVEHGQYLGQMPTLNKYLLTTHIFTGVWCMLVGGLQFWPALRRRWPRVHRWIGGGYILTAPVSVILSLAYMVVTPPHLLYTRMTAWVALWLFGGVALATIALAVRALRQRRIHEHMAYMAVSFACLLVAPMLRLNWVLLAWIWPEIDQETLSLVTMGFMMPECLLIGWGLILANRQHDRALRRRTPSMLAQGTLTWARRLTPLWALLAAALAGLTLMAHLGGSGMQTMAHADEVIRPALLAREAAVLSAHPGWSPLLGLSLALSLVLMVPVFRRHWGVAPPPGRADRVTPALLLSALVAGLSATAIGWQIGLAPQQAWLSGGTFYTVAGLLLTGFAAWTNFTRVVRHEALTREGLVWLMSLLPFAALFQLNLRVLASLPIPSDYVAAGQVYILASAASLSPLFLALFYAVHGQATREHG